jgi:hypothetical protein
MDFTLTSTLQILERTPGVFRALLAGLSADWTEPNEGEGTFNAVDNLGHLIHGERTDWIPRARLILAQGETVRFEPFDRDGHRAAAKQTVAALLDEFDDLRTGNLATLRGWRLTDRELLLEGEHPTFGPVTLRQLLAAWAAHDLGHIAQTSRVLAKQYREAVGPWRAFLPVMDR